MFGSQSPSHSLILQLHADFYPVEKRSLNRPDAHIPAQASHSHRALNNALIGIVNKVENGFYNSYLHIDGSEITFALNANFLVPPHHLDKDRSKYLCAFYFANALGLTAGVYGHLKIDRDKIYHHAATRYI